MIEYGHQFPDGTHIGNIELWCYRNWKKNTDCFLPRYQHLENAIKSFWPEKFSNGDKGYVWSDWAHRRLRAFVDNEYQTWWGPSSAGKSTDAGILVLAHWLSAPHKTTCIVCSTTKEMLERRIWREVVRFHSMLRVHGQPFPGYLRRQPLSITLEHTDESDSVGASTINGIFAVAATSGNFPGVHNDYNVLVVDEGQFDEMAPAFEAYDNLSTGKESKFLAMGNPTSRLDPLGRASEPKRGWHTVSPDIGEWETKRGVCLHFDGLQSPAIDNPEKYFFLLNKKQIDSMRKDPGEDSPRFWSQRRGYVPPEGLVETVLTEAFVEKFQIMQPAMWKNDYKIYLGCDPAFSSGGDSCIVSPFKFGIFTNGMTGIEFMTPIQVNLKISTGEPKTYYLAGEIIRILDEFGITPSQMAIDITGAQRTLADVIEMEWYKKKTGKDKGNTNDVDYPKMHRVEFSGSASELLVSYGDRKKANECYRNKVTELWYMFREFVRHDQIRGMNPQAVREFCSRHLDSKANSYGTNNVIRLETKSDMKARTGGKSPDTADSNVICVDYARNILGVVPGTGSPILTTGFSEKQARYFDLDGGDDLYTKDELWI